MEVRNPYGLQEVRPMPMSTTERASVASRARWAKKTDPAERRAELLPARIASAVRTVVDAAPVLSDEQRARLRAILTDPAPKGGDDHGQEAK